MSLSIFRILNGLEAMDASGGDAVAAARLGFLEWAFCAQGGGTPEAARDALGSDAVRNANSAAARVFVTYLKEATQSVTRPTRRRRRLLH